MTFYSPCWVGNGAGVGIKIKGGIAGACQTNHFLQVHLLSHKNNSTVKFRYNFCLTSITISYSYLQTTKFSDLRYQSDCPNKNFPFQFHQLVAALISMRCDVQGLKTMTKHNLNRQKYTLSYFHTYPFTKRSLFTPSSDSWWFEHLPGIAHRSIHSDSSSSTLFLSPTLDTQTTQQRNPCA